MCSQATFTTAPSPAAPREREVVCFRLDGSQQMLVVAPTMVDMTAPGGGIQYNKAAKGNMDPSGEYYVWTANMGGDRLEAFLVRLPTHSADRGRTAQRHHAADGDDDGAVGGRHAHRLGDAQPTASDNTGVAGVQFRLDGSPIGPEDTSAPYSISWDSATASNGGHAMTAAARDAAGNMNSSAVTSPSPTVTAPSRPRSR